MEGSLSYEEFKKTLEGRKFVHVASSALTSLLEYHGMHIHDVNTLIARLRLNKERVIERGLENSEFFAIINKRDPTNLLKKMYELYCKGTYQL